MDKQALKVALAFVGLTVGAGFASGREVIQYFVGFGIPGLWGAAFAALIFAFTGMVIVQLGSFFLANDHNVVLAGVARPVISRIFDVLITFILFSIGFVMIAGGGANLHQQFGIDKWVGAVVITAMVIAVGMLDVSRVTAVIGALTPVMILFVIIAIGYSLTHIPLPVAELDEVARATGSTLPNWVVSAANYVAMALSMAVSMSIVMGGDISDPRVAGRGGFGGGLLFGLLLVATAGALFTQVSTVAEYDMPLLTLVGTIHPVLGTVMSVVIFAMIFNTAIGMYYALASRFSGGDTRRFRILLVSLALIGFGLSFFGFSTLVGYLYPIIGYVGFALIAVFVFSWVRSRSEIKDEAHRRHRIRRLLARRLRRDKHFSRRDRKHLTTALEESPVENVELEEAIAEDVTTALDEAGIAYDGDITPISTSPELAATASVDPATFDSAPGTDQSADSAATDPADRT